MVNGLLIGLWLIEAESFCKFNVILDHLSAILWLMKCESTPEVADPFTGNEYVFIRDLSTFLSYPLQNDLHLELNYSQR